MILGFFMLWDLPTITRGVESLQNSRLAPVHAELAPALTIFGKLFGRALEAQARIALVNTGLTALGMWLLAIPGIGLLSLFVFICSFIPIAGVIISTTPIGFVALTEYGFIKLALVIMMVTGVHFVEVGREGLLGATLPEVQGLLGFRCWIRFWGVVALMEHGGAQLARL